jgi:lipid-A-disaccharide synthase-like uncharacterized protein
MHRITNLQEDKLMFSCLKETNRENGKPGSLSMRRVSAAICLLTSIALAAFAMVIIYKFTVNSPAAVGMQDWRVFVPLFFPCFSFLFGMLMLLFFTTWEDVKDIVCAASGVNRRRHSDSSFNNTNLNSNHDFSELPERVMN